MTMRLLLPRGLVQKLAGTPRDVNNNWRFISAFSRPSWHLLRQKHRQKDLRQSIENQTKVLWSIAKQVVTDEAKDSNLLFSPLSIHLVLSLLAAGSKGPTRDQLLSFLKSKSVDDLNSLSSQFITLVLADAKRSGGPRLSFANGVWIDQSLPLKPSFKHVVDTVYKSASHHVDFQTKAVEVTNEVNSWVEKETNGLIKELLPSGSVDSSTSLILANALYYKGEWNEKFDTSNTKKHDFHLLNGRSVQVPFMTSMNKQLVRAFNGFKVLGLPYKHGEDNRRFSIYFFLPDAKDGLPALREKVCSESMFLDDHLPYEKVEMGDFRVPKFRISFRFEASKVLKGLGLILPFSSEGLTEMVDSPVGREFYVSGIFYKSFIEVNEEGTEAAAACGCRMRVKASPRTNKKENKIDFVADHPFLFIIREDMTNVVLFIGHLLNPLAS
ncbi:hypothetical protein U1Q18_016227 [Sarracenia purpurea var. burkii]